MLRAERKLRRVLLGGELAELHATVEALRPTLRPQERMAPTPQESVGMGGGVFG